VKRPVVAIDGPAGAGKSTLARGLAEALGLTYVDTGAMYRAVAWKALHLGADLDDPGALGRLARKMRIGFLRNSHGQRVLADGADVTEAVRSPEVTQTASVVAASPGVRRAMVHRQRSLGRDGGVVMEGRDIGTVVFPKADVKFFIDASVRERARRRYKEMHAKDAGVSLAAIEEAIRRRDHRDRNRKDSPLRPAPDAHVVDTTKLSREDVLKRLLSRIPAALRNKGRAPAARRVPKAAA
jgi:cytidylate kinase